MKKLLTLLGLTSLTLSGSAALGSYLAMPSTTNNDILANQNLNVDSLAQNSQYYFPQTGLLNSSSLANGVGLPSFGNLINFDELIDISTVLTNTDLGEFANPPSAIDILDRIETLNPDVDMSQVILIAFDNDAGTATLMVLPGSTVYEEADVELSFTINGTVSLDTVITETNLGVFANVPTEEQLLTRLLDKNMRVDITQLQVEIDAENSFATVSVIEGSTIYREGSVIVVFTIDQRQPLSDVVLNTNLGMFDTMPEENDILMMAFLNNLDLNISDVIVTDITMTQATMTAIDESEFYLPGTSVDVTYTVDQRVDLGTVLTTPELGVFLREPNEDQILARIQQLNPEVNIDELSVILSENGSATVVVNPDSTTYNPGVITVTYTLDQRAVLSEVLVNRNLGVITPVWNFPSNTTDILNRIQELNPDVIMDQIELRDVTTTRATVDVIPNSEVYQPENLTVTFSIDQRFEIGSVVLVTDLGDFDQQPSLEEIMDRVSELNPELDPNQVALEMISDTEVRLVVNEDSVDYLPGELILTFTVDQRVTIRRDIEVTNMGEFQTQPTVQEMLVRIRELNPNLDLNEVTVTIMNFNQAVVRVNEGSTVYFPGAMVLTFRVINRTPLLNDLTITDLGFFGAMPNEQQILGRLADLNPNVQTSELMVSRIANNQAVIRVIDGSTIYNPEVVSVTFGIRVLADFRNDLTNRALGNFETAPSAEEVLDRVAQLNPDLNIDEVEIGFVLNNQAVIRVKAGSEVYRVGALALTFTVQPQLMGLEDVVKEINLGEFDHQPTNQEVLAKAGELNTELDTSQIWISNNRNNQAVINVLPNSPIYRPGSMTLTYTVDQRPSLGEVAANRNLGQFDRVPTVNEILVRIRENNPRLNIGQLLITEYGQNRDKDGNLIAGYHATVDVIEGSNIYRPGTIVFTYTVDGRPAIGQEVVNRNLGQFDRVPTAQQILDRLLSINSNLIRNQLRVSNVTRNSALITVLDNSSIYQPGSVVVVTYTVGIVRVNLDEVITNLDLGTFVTKPNNRDLLLRLQALNPTLDITQIHIVSDNNGTVTVSANAQSYRYLPSTVTATYTLA